MSERRFQRGTVSPTVGERTQTGHPGLKRIFPRRKEVSPLARTLVICLTVIAVVFQIQWLQSSERSFKIPEFRSFFRKMLPLQTWSIQCNYCHSKGTVEHPERYGEAMDCPLCFGLGYNLVRKINDRDMVCPQCNGLGRSLVDRMNSTGCVICGGRGLLVNLDHEPGPVDDRISKIKVVCRYYCDGVGTIDDDQSKTGYRLCPVCYGVGSNDIKWSTENEMICPVPACGGMGRLEDPDTGIIRECNRCGGSGVAKKTVNGEL